MSFSAVTNFTVEDLLGRPPIRLTDWVRRHPEILDVP